MTNDIEELKKLAFFFLLVDAILKARAALKDLNISELTTLPNLSNRIGSDTDMNFYAKSHLRLSSSICFCNFSICRKIS